jgi:hypothetical protein
MEPDPEELPVRYRGPVTLRPAPRKPTFRTRHTAALLFLLLAIVVIGWLLRSLEPRHEPGTSLGDAAELRQFLLAADAKLVAEQPVSLAGGGRGTESAFRLDPGVPRCQVSLVGGPDGAVQAAHIWLPLPPPDSRPASEAASPPAASRPVSADLLVRHLALVRSFLQRFFPRCSEHFELLARLDMLQAAPGQYYPEGKPHHMAWYPETRVDGPLVRIVIAPNRQ